MRSKYEIRAEQELKAEGYRVDYKIRPGSFVPRGYQVDYFGLFDLVAYLPGSPYVRWISIKGVAGQYGKQRKPIEEFKLPSGHQKEIWWVNHVGVWKKDIIP